MKPYSSPHISTQTVLWGDKFTYLTAVYICFFPNQSLGLGASGLIVMQGRSISQSLASQVRFLTVASEEQLQILNIQVTC